MTAPPWYCGAAGQDTASRWEPDSALGAAAQRLACTHVGTGAGRVHALEMVPPAAAADLDHVTDHRLLAAPVPGELGLGGHTPPTGRELCAEDEGHLDEVTVLADRALLTDRPPEIGGRPDQLGMGVADIEARQPALAEFTNDRVPREEVVDLAPGGRGLQSVERSRSEATAARVPPRPRRRTGRPGPSGSARPPRLTTWTTPHLPTTRWEATGRNIRYINLIHRNDVSLEVCSW